MPQQADGKVWNAGCDIHTALQQLPNGDTAAEAADRITGHATSLRDARWTLLTGAGDRLATRRREAAALPANARKADGRVARGSGAIFALRIGDAIAAAVPPGR